MILFAMETDMRKRKKKQTNSLEKTINPFFRKKLAKKKIVKN